MSHNPWAMLIERTLPSEHGASHDPIEEIVEHLHKHNWGAHDIFAVRIAVEEAIVNAIRHGNRCDSSKTVRVVCKIGPSKIRVEVSDEGCGFNPEAVPDCTAPERLEVPSGRGIMLMRSFMTRVEYNAAGNMVIMEKEQVVSTG